MNIDSRAVFEILMRDNADMLLAFLRSAVRDSHAADDLFQETMLTAWRRLADFDRSRPFGPWLRGIAAKLALAHHRRQARMEFCLDESSLEWLEARFAEVQRLAGDTLDEKLSVLRDCVQALPEEYRQPVQLRYAESKSLAEIGVAMKLAIEALKKRLSRAKVRLADCLDRKLQAIEGTP
jgi:RNA polymerase sigma-70 factor (ECF subfamily)